MKLAQEEIREIIAEAKLVRETSLETAKLQLSEMYTPQIQAILSQRLKEDATVDGVDEAADVVEEDKKIADTKSDEDPGKKGEVADGKEPIKEDTHIHVNNDEELEKGDDTAATADATAGDPALATTPETAPTQDATGAAADVVDPAGAPSEDTAGGVDSGTADEVSGDSEEEGDDLDDILRELDMDDDDTDGDGDVDAADGDVDGDGDVDVEDDEATDTDAVKSDVAGAPDKDDDEEEDLEESVDLEATMKEIESHELSELRDENLVLNQQVEELSETVTVLRSTLQEINLLNAKLLFTNKLFKKYSLTEDQKAQIIIQLDRAKTLRETKLVYGTLAESFKAIPTVSKAKKADPGIVQVMEGIASKTTGSTKPVDVLTESATNKGGDIIPLSPLAERFQQLARINQPR